MKTYILVLIIGWHPEVFNGKEFKTKVECESAGQAVLDAHKGITYPMKYICADKDAVDDEVMKVMIGSD